MPATKIGLAGEYIRHITPAILKEPGGLALFALHRLAQLAFMRNALGGQCVVAESTSIFVGAENDRESGRFAIFFPSPSH